MPRRALAVPLQPVATRSLADVLTRIARLGLSCVGAGLRPDGSVELRVQHELRLERTGEAVRAGWPGAVASVQRERHGDATSHAVEVQPGLWLTWRVPAPRPSTRTPPPPPVRTDRLAAYHVGVSDQDGDAEVVLASSADEAAACYAEGWGLRPGTVLAVSAEPLGDEDTLDGVPPQVFVVEARGGVSAWQGWGARRP